MREHGNRGKGKGIAFLRSLIGHRGNDCVLWPLRTQTDGYGNLGFNGKLLRAHRMMCEMTNGPAPAGHEASHSCGVAACVNPNHLAWKTRAANEADKRRHGTQGGGAASRRKFTHLTAEQVADIRRNKGKLPQHVLAKRYGLKRGGVRYWQSTSHAPRPTVHIKIERIS